MKTVLSNFISFSEAVLDLEMRGLNWRTTSGGSELSAQREVLQYQYLKSKLEKLIEKSETSDEIEPFRAEFLRLLGVETASIDSKK